MIFVWSLGRQYWSSIKKKYWFDEGWLLFEWKAYYFWWCNEFIRKCWFLSIKSLLYCPTRKGIIVLKLLFIFLPIFRLINIQIQTLSKISPKDRLELLREVAGTRVYDDRREESLRILDETSGKREKIDEVLVFLDERLEELEKEKEELKGYQEQDRTRRVLEYTIYTKELTDINNRLDQLEGMIFEIFKKSCTDLIEDHLRDIQEMGNLHKQSKNMHEELKTAEKDLKSMYTELEKLRKEKDFVLTDLSELQKKKAQLDLKVNQSTNTVTIDAKKQKEYTQELIGLKKDIAKAKKQLDNLQPNYVAAVKKEQDARER